MTDEPGRDGTHAQDLRAQLVAELAAAGAFPDDRWHQVFAKVPRHRFVPKVFAPVDSADAYRPLDGTDPDHRAEWLEHVYADDIAITQLDGDDRAWHTAVREGAVTAEAMTCTSSQPTLMAGMLAELDVADGHRVLEVGTGTGYNAALLCERLGSDLVTTVDIDPVLVERARAALAGLAYAPRLVAADGAAGVPDRAPFDRIVVTAAFPSIPSAWIAQTADGGVVLANLGRPLDGIAALVRLTVRGGVAEGRFRPRPAGYMPTRTDRTPSALALYRKVSEAEENAAPVAGTGGFALAAALAEPGFRFFLGMRSNIEELGVRYPDHPAEQWLLTDDSWAFATTTGEVRQGGTRRLFDEVAALHRAWVDLGRPDRDGFGLSVSADGGHRLWLGSADEGPVWDMEVPEA